MLPAQVRALCLTSGLAISTGVSLRALLPVGCRPRSALLYEVPRNSENMESKLTSNRGGWHLSEYPHLHVPRTPPRTFHRSSSPRRQVPHTHAMPSPH